MIGVPFFMARANKTIIHVNMHIIRANRETGASNPVLTVKRGRENHRAHVARIDGPSEVVYRPDHPLSCGARVWIETHAPVYLDGATEPLV